MSEIHRKGKKKNDHLDGDNEGIVESSAWGRRLRFCKSCNKQKLGHSQNGPRIAAKRLDSPLIVLKLQHSSPVVLF